MIKLRTLGEAVIEIGDEAFTPDSDALFSALLYLATERGTRVSRDLLADMLWPRMPERRARHCLRQLIYRLRVLGVAIEGARDSITLPAHLVVPTFAADPTLASLRAEREAGTLVLGPFLPGYTPRYSEPFAEWFDGAKSETEAGVRRALLELVQVHRLRGEWAQVDELSRECLRIDPLNEEATLALAESVAMTGGKIEAIELLERFSIEVGARHPELGVPAAVLRRRIAERLPAHKYTVPSDHCFVGRGKELEDLSQALLRARHGQSDAILMLGSAGMGKSRLVSEFCNAAVLQGVRIARASCDDGDRERPMSPWIDATRQLLRMPGALGISPDSMECLKRLTDIEPRGPVSPMPINELFWVPWRTRRAILDLIDSVATEGTLVLVIEDVQWLDAPSWSTISGLLEWVGRRRVLVLLTCRDAQIPTAPMARAFERLRQVRVDGLAHAHSVDLVRSIALDVDQVLDDERVAWCAQVGEGNPLFLRELAVHCLNGGAIGVAPPTVQALLDARLDRLSGDATNVLQAAAILGGRASVDRVEDMLELPAHRMLTAVAALSRTALLDECAAGIATRHELVRSRVLGRLPVKTRQLLHRRAAAILQREKEFGAPPDLVADLLHHWQAAGEESRCPDIVVDTATQPNYLGAPDEAIRLLTSWEHVLLSPSHFLKAARVRVRALSLQARWEEAYATCEQIVATSRLSGAQDPEDSTLLIESGIRAGKDIARLESLSLELASNRANSAGLRIKAARHGMGITMLASRQPDHTAYWNAVSDLVVEPGGQDLATMILTMVYEADVGSIGRAIAIGKRVRDRSVEIADVFERLSALVAVSDTFRIAGRYDDAKNAANEAICVARAAGSVHFELSGLLRVAIAHIETGNIEAARSVHSDLKERWAPTGVGVANSSVAFLGARIALEDGRLDEAREFAVLEWRGSVWAEGRGLWAARGAACLLAELQLRSESGKVDADLLSDLADVHRATATFPLHDRTAAVLCVALMRAGRFEEAERTLEEYLNFQRRAIGPWEDVLRRLRLAHDS